ncbi:unnamed protein product [Symbiodinium sp. CCMP2592]|nr:unnamed protein product [Symbiodinium sp. CCMP2592]
MSAQASAGDHDAPSWDGNPATYQAFETSCRWYVLTLKDSEKAGAAARVWAKLSGPAKSVVRHLDPEQYYRADGLEKLLTLLRGSPLQTLPVPDCFAKLERWNTLRRKDHETIPEFLVREDECFTELQQSLKRSRDMRKPPPPRSEPPGDENEDDAKQSPMEDFEDLPDFRKTSPSSSPRKSPKVSQPDVTVLPEEPADFNDELRGYRLLKATNLTVQERQQVLTLAGNLVNFQVVRQALRAFFDDSGGSHRHRHRDRHAWWATETEDPDGEHFDCETGPPEDFADAYWGDLSWSQQGWEDWPDEGLYYDGAEDEGIYYDAAGNEIYPEDMYPEEEAEPSQEEAESLKQQADATALAAEANRTLTEARAAVAKVRAARGYYPLGGKSSSKGGRGSSPTRCLICGQLGHWFRDCPRRFQGQTAMYQKGFPKGPRPKGKGKGKFRPPGKGKAKQGFPVNFYGTYMMEVVREEGQPDFYQNDQPSERNANVVVPVVDPSDLTMGNGPAVWGRLEGNGHGRALGIFENEQRDVWNNNVPLNMFNAAPADQATAITDHERAFAKDPDGTPGVGPKGRPHQHDDP